MKLKKTLKNKNRKNKKTRSKRGGKSLRLKQRGGELGGWQITGIIAAVMAALAAGGFGGYKLYKSIVNPRIIEAHMRDYHLNQGAYDEKNLNHDHVRLSPAPPRSREPSPDYDLSLIDT